MDPCPHLQSGLLARAGFAHAFFTRRGGVSEGPFASLNLSPEVGDRAEHVRENLGRAAHTLGLAAERLYVAAQVHDRGVISLHGSENASVVARTAADALVSSTPGSGCGVRTADCVPILIGDPVTGAFAAVHAGWRGTLATAVIAGVERLAKEYDARPEDLRAAIGASAGPCCYEVGSEVIEAFSSKFVDGEKLFTPTRDGHARVDLLKANRDQLISTGVKPERIHIAPLCTMCRTDLFFSYRREKSVHGKVGRLMAVVGREP